MPERTRKNVRPGFHVIILFTGFVQSVLAIKSNSESFEDRSCRFLVDEQVPARQEVAKALLKSENQKLIWPFTGIKKGDI